MTIEDILISLATNTTQLDALDIKLSELITKTEELLRGRVSMMARSFTAASCAPPSSCGTIRCWT